MLKQFLRRGALVVVGLASVLLISSGWMPNPVTAGAPFSFTNFVLSSTPGVTCPGSTACFNNAGEPQIRADKAGNFYATSENGLGGGTQAWKSTDGGTHYTALTSPNSTSAANSSFGPSGGDTDVAIAPVKNASGQYNAYVASLSLANVSVSTTSDGGKTWSMNPAAATISGDDREWIAADGASKVCISYHDVATFNLDVNCSYDAGTTFTQLGETFDTNHAFAINNNESGNLAIDPNNHYVYQIFSSVANSNEITCGQAGTCGYHVVWVGVSTDGGKTFTDYAVYNNPNTTVSYGHQFTNLSIDSAGNVYAVYSDNHNLYYSYSTNHGQTWSAPVQVNQGTSATAIMPWSVAGSNGRIDIVWYGSPYYDGVNPPDNYPASAQWYVYFAQNIKATTGGKFTQAQVTPVIHTGGVCESGVACTGNRDLYDDFGVSANPLTGLASIVYDDDQYSQTGGNMPNCTSSNNSTASCLHTSIATQTAGNGIYGK